MNTDKLFVTALENKDIESLRTVPKTDLHNHFGNGGNREYIIEKTGVYIPPLTERFNSMEYQRQTQQTS